MTDTGQGGVALDYTKTREQIHKDLHILRVADLKPILAQWRLIRSGSKSDLIDRLLKTLDDRHHAGRTDERNKLIQHIQDEVYRLKSSWGMVPVRAGVPRPATPVGNQWGQPQMNGSIGNLHMAVGGGGAGAATQHQCICYGTALAQGGDKACAICKAKFHPLCYGHFYPYPREHCFLCISKYQDPYYEVQSTLCGPIKSVPQRTEITLQFKLSPRDQSEACRTDASGVRKMRILVRCFALYPQEQSRKVGQKMPTFPPHCWPLESQVRINNHIPVVIKQRHVFYQNQLRKWKGVSDPVDIFAQLRVGLNRLTIMHKDDKPYVAFVQLVRRVPPEELIKKVESSPNNPTMEQALQRVKESFRGKGGLGDDDDDDELMTTVTRISVRCPVGLVPIERPAKGRNCNHLQCFDLGTFLHFNEKNTTASWKCGVCNKPLTIDELEVDKFMLDIVKKLKDAKHEGTVSDDVDTVEIDCDGTWKPHRTTVGGDRKRKADDSVASDTGAGSAEACKGESSTARDGDVIVMDDDDDDDDVRPPPAKAARPDTPCPSPPRQGEPAQPPGLRVFMPGPAAAAAIRTMDSRAQLAVLQRLFEDAQGANDSLQNGARARGVAPAPAPPPARAGSSSSGGRGGAVIDLTLSDSDDDFDDNKDRGGRSESSTDEDDDEGPMRRRRAFQMDNNCRLSPSESDADDDSARSSFDSEASSSAGYLPSMPVNADHRFLERLPFISNFAMMARAASAAQTNPVASSTPAPVAAMQTQPQGMVVHMGGVMAGPLPSAAAPLTSVTTMPTASSTMTFAPSMVQPNGYTIPASSPSLVSIAPAAPTTTVGSVYHPAPATTVPHAVVPSVSYSTAQPSLNAVPQDVRPPTASYQGPIRIRLPGSSAAARPPSAPVTSAVAPSQANPGNPTPSITGLLPQTMYQQGGSAAKP